jgi:hypothetical protein
MGRRNRRTDQPRAAIIESMADRPKVSMTALTRTGMEASRGQRVHLEAALVAYTIPAMFASIPYFELFYVLIALTGALKRIVQAPGSIGSAPGPAARRPLAAARGRA